MKSRYSQRGVSAKKEDVHKAIQNLDKGLYPNAFCKILPDHAAGDPDYVNIVHADTAGTKTALAYLYWKETGDANAWKNIVQDAIVMNLDDLACVGAVDNIILSSTIGRNKNLIPGEVIEALIQGTVEFTNKLKASGVNVYLSGGETADVGDIVRTIDVGYTAFVRMPQKELIINNIQPGDVIVGLASFGQAEYEKSYNSGIGSNGLTSARHDVLNKSYAKRFPESYDPSTAEEVVYCGSKNFSDKVGGHSVGELLLSPTRTYLPVLKEIFKKDKDKINGIIHCTGGGQTKVLHFIKNIRVIKDNLFPVPPVFELIQKESGTDWKEMYQVFNMGHRMEFYLPEQYAAHIIDTAEKFNIDAKIIGRCEAAGEKEVMIETAEGNQYSYK